MTDQHQHRATPEQWAKVKGNAPGPEVCSCLIELRDRIEALEATQHAHAITGPTDQLHSYKVGPAEPVEDWGKGHTQVRQHLATPEQWAFTESRGEWRWGYATCSCILELRDRIQLLEATQHAHIEAKAAGAQVGRSSAAVDRVRDLQDQIRDGTLTLAKALKEINGKPIERTRQTTYLVEKIRVRMIQEQKNSNSWQAVADAVLREVAEWLRSEYPQREGYGTAWANLLDNEANL
jgi:hypothetical protein